MTHLTYNNLSQLDLQQFEYFQEELAKSIWYDLRRVYFVIYIEKAILKQFVSTTFLGSSVNNEKSA
jgi:hypothetical protein